MKTKLRKAALGLGVLAGLSAGILPTSQVHADDSNPYNEGIAKVRLSPEEKAALLQYADNSKTRLEKAMDRARGKGFSEANAIYLSTIKAVVLNSYVQKPRSELLMRVSLNQALALTFGMPTTDGKSVQSPGVLKDISNVDLLTVILEDSIRLALNYYQDDRTAIQKGTLVDLPYMDQAVRELSFSRKWLMSVTEPTAKYNLSVATLQSFLNTAANEDQMHRALFAEELTEVSDLLDSLPSQVPTDVDALMRNVRMLRGKLKRLQESVAQKAQVSQPISDGSGATSMRFVSIQPGSFLMGSPSNESGRYDDEAQHRVTLTRGFEMQATTVTQAQWVQVMGSNPSKFQGKDNCPQTYIALPVAMCPNHPVEQVSWGDVQVYITKLNQLRKDGYGYRLPTDAEWEYAARAGTTTAYSFGDDASPLSQYAWYSANSQSQTHDVALLKPNRVGLYDMHGNVWQWVQDWYVDSTSEQQTDPVGPAVGSYRVVRGGSWGGDARGLRSAYRGYVPPDSRDSHVGFRLVRTR